MTTGHVKSDWQCATCRMPVVVKNSRFTGGVRTFPVMVIVKNCDCAYDGIINQKQGRFLSPEAL